MKLFVLQLSNVVDFFHLTMHLFTFNSIGHRLIIFIKPLKYKGFIVKYFFFTVYVKSLEIYIKLVPMDKMQFD